MSALLKQLGVLKRRQKGGDEEMLHILRSVNDDLIIATEAKYRKNCFSLYVLKKDSKLENKESAYEASFKEFAADITKGIREGKVYEMASLLHGSL